MAARWQDAGGDGSGDGGLLEILDHFGFGFPSTVLLDLVPRVVRHNGGGELAEAALVANDPVLLRVLDRRVNVNTSGNLHTTPAQRTQQTQQAEQTEQADRIRLSGLAKVATTDTTG